MLFLLGIASTGALKADPITAARALLVRTAPELADAFHLLPFKAAKLRALHDSVLEAEKQAFGDSADVTAAKRSLFDIQVDGVTGKGSRITPLGRLLLSGDIEKRLQRRLRFASYLHLSAEVKAQAARPIKAPIIIGGLPRTGTGH